MKTFDGSLPDWPPWKGCGSTEDVAEDKGRTRDHPQQRQHPPEPDPA